MLCGCIYRSPSKERFITIESTGKVCKIINEAVQRKNSYLLICGDFNYPSVDWENEYIRENGDIIKPFLDTIQANFLYQHTTQPTRYRQGHEPNLLDLVITNEVGMINEFAHCPPLGESDHECLLFNLECYQESHKKDEVPARNYFKADYTTIQQRLSKVDWTRELQGDFTSGYINFTRILEASINGCIPEYKTKKKKKNMYLTAEAIRKKDLKNKLWRRYKRTKFDYDHERYLQAKNQLRTLTRTLRTQFERGIAQDIKTAPKKFWSYVKSRTKTKSKIPILKKDGVDVVSAKEKAETLNNFFISNFTEERLHDIPANNETLFLGTYLDSFVITPEMVLEKLKELKAEKSPGLDGWHPYLLKCIDTLIHEPLSNLFQKSLIEGLVPWQWLDACVTAIHKKVLKNQLENYRPISITSIICKLMESIIRDNIVTHMGQNDIISKKQHGFIPNRNCMTNLLTCMEKWTQMLENGEPIDIIYTDFAKAFDRVPHQRLLQKMKALGIIGNTLNWVKSFLSGRRQQVRVENEFSSWGLVKSGIPQGSVLGPTLFVLFINDMPDVCLSTCQLFADDANIFRSVSSSEEIETLQRDLDKLSEWSSTWQLPFNVGKCKSLHIGKQNRRNIYEMSGTKLDQVREEKDLGVVIDDQLKFHKQTAGVIKKANSVLGVIKRCFARHDSSTLPLLFKSMVRPHLEYGNVVWGPYYKEDIKAVERVQRRATKLISGLHDMSYGDRLRHLKLPSLAYRRLRGDMIYTYKIMTGKMDISKDDFFKTSKLSTRGHRLKIFKQHATTLNRINTFSSRIVNEWNSLPSEIVNAISVNSFKERLDKHWIERVFETPF